MTYVDLLSFVYRGLQMTPNFVPDRRPEPRYEIVRARSVNVLVTRPSHESQKTIFGELHNLSSGGVQLFLPAYLRFSETIELQISIPEANIQIDVAADVRWIRPLADNHCLIGCSLPIKLSEVVLDRLATAGIIDRRRHPRRVVSVPAAARRELDADTFPVSIIDYSECGFCMVSARSITVGGAVSIEFDARSGEAPIAGTVCWQEQRDGECVLGCSLKRLEDVEQLRRSCNASSHQHRTRSTSPQAQTRPTLFLAVMWLLVFAGGMVIGLQAIDRWRGQPTKPQLAGQLPKPRASAPIAKSGPAAADNSRNHRDSIALQATPGEAVSTVGPQPSPAMTTWQVSRQAAMIGDRRAQVVSDTDVWPSAAAPSADPSRSVASEWHVPGEASASSLVEVEVPHAEELNPEPRFADANVPADEGAAVRPSPSASGRSARPSVDGKTPERVLSIVEPGTPPRIAGQVDRASEQQVAVVAASRDRTKAKEAFAIGERLYRAKRYREAVSAFEQAAQYDPQNALCYYLLAITRYELRQFADATDAARRAIHLEQEQPIENRGARLSRYQGRARVWIEQLRSRLSTSTSHRQPNGG